MLLCGKGYLECNLGNIIPRKSVREQRGIYISTALSTMTRSSSRFIIKMVSLPFEDGFRSGRTSLSNRIFTFNYRVMATALHSPIRILRGTYPTPAILVA